MTKALPSALTCTWQHEDAFAAILGDFIIEAMPLPWTYRSSFAGSGSSARAFSTASRQPKRSPLLLLIVCPREFFRPSRRKFFRMISAGVMFSFLASMSIRRLDMNCPSGCPYPLYAPTIGELV